jgi:hypothetical protein
LGGHRGLPPRPPARVPAEGFVSDGDGDGEIASNELETRVHDNRIGSDREEKRPRYFFFYSIEEWSARETRRKKRKRGEIICVSWHSDMGQQRPTGLELSLYLEEFGKSQFHSPYL